jgi:heat shock protein HtpX
MGAVGVHSEAPEEKVNSFFKTTLLLASLTGLLVGMGYVLGGPSVALIALVFAGIMNFVAYFFSDKLALSMAGAKEVTREEEPELHRMVAEVARLSEMPMPRVFVVQNESPNAFATGRDPKHAVVAVTTGIRRILTDRELRAVIGHEMGHVKNRDILTSSIAATIAGAISYLGMMAFWMGGMFGGRDGDRPNPLIGLVMFIVAPIAASILQMALSRTREYAADRSGAEYTHDPMALASALGKLQSGVAMNPMEQKAGAQAMSSLYIVHPFSAGGLGNLFSTHPPVEERIRRLQEMARGV